MEKFSEFVKKLVESYPNAPTNPAHETLFQDRLSQWFSEYKTPDHPPYSAMIERALSELNENNGSTEDEISQFIIKEYDALPWAHLTLLGHHLGILCRSGDIVMTRSMRYMLAGENAFLTSSTKGKKKKRRRKSRRAWERDGNKQRKKRNQPKGNSVDCIEECKEEHQEERQTNDNQLAVSSPERPPGFKSIIVENLSDSGIFLRTCLSSQEQSIVVGERELDLPIDVKKLDSPRERSVHELSIYENFLELKEVKRSSEAYEMAVSVQEGNPKSVKVYEIVSNASVASYRRCNKSKSPKEEAIPDMHVPRWQSGIVSASVEEISTLKRTERQQKRWSLHSPKAVNFIGPDISPNSDYHQLPQLKLSDAEMPQEQREESVSSPNPEQPLVHVKPQCDLLEADVMEAVQSVTIESKAREIKVYGRRTKTRPEQLQSTIQVVPMNSDVNLFEPNALIDFQNSSMNEHEPRELPQQPPELLQQPPLVQGEALQDKPSHDEDASLIDMIQPEHQHEECQKTPPKHKSIIGMCKVLSPSRCQEMKHASRKHQEPPKHQMRQRPCKVKADVSLGGNTKSIQSPKVEANQN